VVAAKEVREGPDVVLVPVGKEYADDAIAMILERAEVRVDHVDAEPASIEGDAAVYE
jgi:hypothetical protein